LLDQWLSTIPQHSWVSKLFGYQFSVEFKPSHQNGAVDALSRRDKEYVAINALSLPEFDLFEQFHQESTNLPKIVAQRNENEVGRADKKWAIVDDIIVRNGHIFMPASSASWVAVLEQAHGMGHEAV
jgi:hypothetical protein